MPFQLYNSLTKRLEPFTPANPQKISFYTCGPTVYDDAHIGNFRSFLAADLLRRWLESPLCTLDHAQAPQTWPRTVTHVMNITDVGHMTDDESADGSGQDKMEVAKQRILESKKSGTLPADAQVDPNDPAAIARFYEARFKEDAKLLGLKVAIEADKDPSLMPRATDNIAGMKQVIAKLLDDGCAYAAGQPGSRAIYFDVQRFNAYGNLSGNTLDKLRGGAGGRVDDTQQQEKHHPADFLLWKEDESHTMKWPAPNHPDTKNWGEGYPGWHIECTAMALGRLVDGGLNAAAHNHSTIDLHSGGEDNIFPHHECEIAQSCCFTGNQSFARHWFHPRFLMVEGQKMSKSKGTMHTLRDLTAKGIDPAAIRLELIKTHYRANADFSMQGLKDSARTIERWRRFKDSATPSGGSEHAIRQSVQDALNDDLNIAGAIGAINAWIKRTDNPTTTDAVLLDEFDAILGVLALKKPEAAQSADGIALYQPGVSPSEEIESLLTQRRDAKQSKDFAAADAIRDQLTAMGLSIMDKPGGKVEVAPAN